MPAVILDACALIAYLRDEPGCERFEESFFNPMAPC
jgi:hypothetical protein